MIWLYLLACSSDPAAPAKGPGPSSTGPEVQVLDPVARASRVSVALRGERPTPEELATVASDPTALSGLVDEWIDTDAFGATVRDLHAWHFWLRADARNQWPARHELEVFTQQEVTTSFQEAPLMLVEEIVRSGAPYTDIVTADYTLADDVIAAMEGLPYDPSGPEWQRTHHVDGRPQAGLMSSTGLWQRWYTNNSGKHRNRANLVSRIFLCDEIGALDLPVFPVTDTTDDAATADALRNDPGCVACHANLDPLAAYFWPYYINITGELIDSAYEAGCGEDGPGNPDHCYPIRYFNPGRSDLYQLYDLPPPGYYGTEAADFAAVGASIAEDPRFAGCAVSTAWSWFSQRNERDLPDELREQLVEDFVASGHDYRAMIKQLVLSDAVADATVEPLQLRPEAYERLLLSLSSSPWVLPLSNFGDVPAMQNSRYGVRDLAGGLDHDHVLYPNHSPGTTVLLALDAMAQHAARSVAEQGELVDTRVTSEELGRIQLADLATRSTGRLVDPTDPLVDDLWLLHTEAVELTGSSADAWRITLRGLFLDPSTLTY